MTAPKPKLSYAACCPAQQQQQEQVFGAASSSRAWRGGAWQVGAGAERHQPASSVAARPRRAAGVVALGAERQHTPVWGQGHYRKGSLLPAHPAPPQPRAPRRPAAPRGRGLGPQGPLSCSRASLQFYGSFSHSVSRAALLAEPAAGRGAGGPGGSRNISAIGTCSSGGAQRGFDIYYYYYLNGNVLKLPCCKAWWAILCWWPTGPSGWRPSEAHHHSGKLSSLSRWRQRRNSFSLTKCLLDKDCHLVHVA